MFGGAGADIFVLSGDGHEDTIREYLIGSRGLALGGPLACLLNASLSVPVLVQIGAIAAPDALFSWWTWWLGDAVGSVLCLPLVLVMQGQPASHWRSRSPVRGAASARAKPQAAKPCAVALARMRAARSPFPSFASIRTDGAVISFFTSALYRLVSTVCLSHHGGSRAGWR